MVCRAAEMGVAGVLCRFYEPCFWCGVSFVGVCAPTLSPLTVARARVRSRRPVFSLSLCVSVVWLSGWLISPQRRL